MRFDTLIIGGGLSGLTCGIALAEKGQRVGLVSYGQSTLHFFSGSFDLLGYDWQGQWVEHPLQAMAQLSVTHPYVRIGIHRTAALAREAERLLTQAGLSVTGQVEYNHQRISPLGQPCPAWLTVMPDVSTPSSATTPFRLPTSAGLRVQEALRRRFEQLGGRFLLGDRVRRAILLDNQVHHVHTTLLDDDALKAAHYVLCTGSFMSGGLVANYEQVYEPLFGLDLEGLGGASVRGCLSWTTEDVFAPQPYMYLGVRVNAQLQALKDGEEISNLYVAGSLLAGHNAVQQADGTGVSIISALAVAENIMKS